MHSLDTPQTYHALFVRGVVFILKSYKIFKKILEVPSELTSVSQHLIVTP